MTRTANQCRRGVVSGTRPGWSCESGYTLVELLIYSSLLVLVLTVVGGMLLNTLTSEQKVLDSADANSVSQLIASSIQSGGRNATRLQLTESADVDNDNQLLVVTSVSSDPNETAADRFCQAWFYTEADGGAMYYQRAAPIVSQTEGALAGDMAGWTLLGSGLSAVSGQAILEGSNDENPLISLNPSISLNFAISADGDSSPALISTTVTSRQTAASNGTPCFS